MPLLNFFKNMKMSGKSGYLMMLPQKSRQAYKPFNIAPMI
jgi:hypothetical protein